MAPKLYLYQTQIGDVHKISQKMTMQMSEKYLSQFETSCVQRHFCSNGAVSEIGFEKKEIMEQLDEDIKEVTEYSVM
jgi:hypothetical protein